MHVSEKKYIFPSRLTTGGTVIIRRDEWITPFSRGSFRSKSNTFHGMGNEMKDGGYREEFIEQSAHSTYLLFSFEICVIRK